MKQDHSEEFVQSAVNSSPGVDPVIETESESVFTDNRGVAFSPDLHKTNEDGSPKLSKTGNLMRKKGKAFFKDPAIADSAKAYRFAATQATNLFLVGGSYLSDNFLPQKPADKKDLATVQLAFEVYFEANDISDFPPGIGLCVALLAYSIPRLQNEKAKSNIDRIISPLRGVFRKIVGLIKRKNKTNGAHVDNRSGGIRKDDTSEDSSQEIVFTRSGGSSSGSMEG